MEKGGGKAKSMKERKKATRALLVPRSLVTLSVFTFFCQRRLCDATTLCVVSREGNDEGLHVDVCACVGIW